MYDFERNEWIGLIYYSFYVGYFIKSMCVGGGGCCIEMAMHGAVKLRDVKLSLITEMKWPVGVKHHGLSSVCGGVSVLISDTRTAVISNEYV